VRLVLRALLALFGIAAIAAVALLALSELGGEVALLRTRDASGEWRETRVWVVEWDHSPWLRAGARRAWFARVVEDGEVELVRDGLPSRYRAIPFRDAPTRERIDQLMRERYGVADRVIGWIGRSRDATPIRLEPLAAP
jgi:hypothetical protein